MDTQELERRLIGFDMNGIEFPTDSEDYMGIIIVRKRFRGPLTLEDVEIGSDQYESILRFSQAEPDLYEKRVETGRDVQERPIMVLVMELAKAVYEVNAQPQEKDYRRRNVSYVTSIQEVEEHLNQLGYGIADLNPLE
jgi:hypothetical protein